MRKFFERAVSNITSYGDTDIFPFPVENQVMFDKKQEFVDELVQLDKDFRTRINTTPPTKYNSIVPIGYAGFRWATQIDPLWNAYLLGLVLSLADHIESQRIEKSKNVVFSYRINRDVESSEIFDLNVNWRAFMLHSLSEAAKSKNVVVCDVSEFYGRINHHRLENALKHLNHPGSQTRKIMKILGLFSETYSVGIPVGGPAARILSEICLDQVDKLLRLEGVNYCRFADDYHIFCNSQEDAFSKLIALSEKLLRNQVLQLQKSKTRIMSSQEFIATSPFVIKSEEPDEQIDLGFTEQAQRLIRMSLRFDPYSETPDDDYRRLQRELGKFDIIGLLKSELLKSRVHITLTKKIIASMTFLAPSVREDAALTLLENHELLYPVFSNILVLLKDIYDELGSSAAKEVCERVRNLIRNNSYVMQIDVHLSYAVRLLSKEKSFENEEILSTIFRSNNSEIVRRDIILAMARWKTWHWLSDVRSAFSRMSAPERRALLIASFMLRDEGKHWRDHVSGELSGLENLVKNWASEKIQLARWQVPL